jgi:hypothetical protein
MRSLSLTALAVLAAFALGLAAGGRVPGDAAAAPVPPVSPGSVSLGVDWKLDAKALTLTNGSSEASFLAVGKLRKPGLASPVPAQVAGQLAIPIGDINSLIVYRLQAALVCGRNGCRPCQPPFSRTSDCPIPPPIPIGAQQYQVNLGPRGGGRP